MLGRSQRVHARTTTEALTRRTFALTGDALLTQRTGWDARRRQLAATQLTGGAIWTDGAAAAAIGTVERGIGATNRARDQGAGARTHSGCTRSGAAVSAARTAVEWVRPHVCTGYAASYLIWHGAHGAHGCSAGDHGLRRLRVYLPATARGEAIAAIARNERQPKSVSKTTRCVCFAHGSHSARLVACTYRERPEFLVAITRTFHNSLRVLEIGRSAPPLAAGSGPLVRACANSGFVCAPRSCPAVRTPKRDRQRTRLQ
jgi:hypothetical protein